MNTHDAAETAALIAPQFPDSSVEVIAEVVEEAGELKERIRTFTRSRDKCLYILLYF